MSPTEALGYWLQSSPSRLTGTPDPLLAKTNILFMHLQRHASFAALPATFVPGLYEPPFQAVLHTPTGGPGMWAMSPDEHKTARWRDSPRSGLGCRDLYRLEDALGATGTIGRSEYRFEEILQIGEVTVVYKLSRIGTDAYVACGCVRGVFDALHDLKRHLWEINAGIAKLAIDDLVALCDRVLRIDPGDETAASTRGIALLAANKFSSAHQSFEVALRTTPDKLLNLLYDACALAEMGDQERAADRLITLSSVHGSELGPYLHEIERYKAALSAAVLQALKREPSRRSELGLWVEHLNLSV